MPNDRIDYRAAYDAYWSRADRAGSHSMEDPDGIVEQILASCGTGRFLDVGCGNGLLVRKLLARGADAFGVDVSTIALKRSNATAPDRFVTATALALPFTTDAFDTIVTTDCLEHLAEEDLPAVLHELWRATRRSLFVRLATTPDRDGKWHLTVHDRAWWETRFFEAGFRKHPAYYDVLPYESLESEPWQITLLLEKIPERALAAYPLRALAAERDLHMDMMRETGARSDAHVSRYQLATQYVRTGDDVLDAACGLGYGSYVLHQRTMARHVTGIDESCSAIEYARCIYPHAAGLRFRRGRLPECLAESAADSYDLIVSFETLEHVADPQALWSEFLRVLKPAGRVIVSVPNDWSDETGFDPNPYHLQVYDAHRLVRELPRGLVLEALYEQTASRRKTGRGAEWETAGRRLRRLTAMDGEPHPRCEWWIAVAMKDPLLGQAVPYRETSFPDPRHVPGWNVTAFDRDYANPWLVKGMVTIGHRLTDRHALAQLARRELDVAAPGTSDSGAALCVLAYDVLAREPMLAGDAEAIHERIASYAAAAAQGNPHQVRWLISLWFVDGLLWQGAGFFDRAAESYERCARIDPLRFSPLIATKTVEAWLRLGLLHAAVGALESARGAWIAGIEAAERALGADWSTGLGERAHPVEFGLPELAAVAEKASACAYALTHLDIAADRPGVWWWQHNRDRLSQLGRGERQRRALGALQQALAAKEAGLSVQAAEIQRLEREYALKLDALASQGEQLRSAWQDIQRLATEVESSGKALEASARALEASAKALAASENELALRTRELGHRTEELNAIRRSRWHQLGETLRGRDNLLRKGYRVARLGASIVRHRWRERQASPAEASLPTGGASPAAVGVSSAYAIRVPAPAREARPRVVHALANFMTGGSSRLVVDLIEGVGSDYEQRVITSHVPEPPAYTGARVDVIGVDAPDAAFDRLLDDPRPEFVHVHYWGDCDEPWYARVFAAVERKGIPVLENVNTPVQPFLSPAVVRYVYVSDYVRREFPVEAGRTEVIHPGSDLALFTHESEQRDDGNTIGMVYRLENDKLAPSSIDPFIEIVRRRPDTYALIVGGGSLLEPFRAKVRAAQVEQHFEFTGYVAYDRLPELYARMTVFIAPVFKESFGQVSTFAMGMAKPVVGYAVGGIPEIIDDPELVAPKDDPVALAQIVLRLLADPAWRRAVGSRNRARALELFTVEQMIRRYALLYRTMETAG